jgi:hypothetical protein
MFSSGRRAHRAWAFSVNSQINVTDYEKLRYRRIVLLSRKTLRSFRYTIKSGIVRRRELVYVSGNVNIANLPASNYLKEILA